MLYPRLITNICLLLAVFMMPWWVAACIAVAACIVFEHFYEVLIAGFVMDALYGVTTTTIPARSFLFFTGAATVLLLFELAKPRIRVFERW